MAYFTHLDHSYKHGKIPSAASQSGSKQVAIVAHKGLSENSVI